MEGAIHGLQGIFEVIFIISIGFILSRKGWFDSNTSALLTKIVMKVALPFYMVVNMVRDFTHDSLVQIAPDLVLPFASIFWPTLWEESRRQSYISARTGRGYSLPVFYCQYNFYRSACQSGLVRSQECAVGHALLYGQYNYVLDIGGVSYRQ